MAPYAAPFTASSRPVAPCQSWLGGRPLRGRVSLAAVESEPLGLRPGPPRSFDLQPKLPAWQSGGVGQQDSNAPPPTPLPEELLMPRPPRPVHLLRRYGASIPVHAAPPAPPPVPAAGDEEDVPAGVRLAKPARLQQHTVPNVLVASCALVNAEGRVLLGMRTKGNTKLRGFFEFPGGKVRGGGERGGFLSGGRDEGREGEGGDCLPPPSD